VKQTLGCLWALSQFFLYFGLAIWGFGSGVFDGAIYLF
jgi:hypothetical protein